MNNLTPEMQKRLDKWKQNTLPVKSVEALRGKPPSFDEMEREMHEHERKQWQESNRGRR